MAVGYVRYSGTIIVETCCKCGVTFGLTDRFRDEHVENGKDFYCPNGHPQHYTTSLAAQLKEAQAKAEREREWAKRYADMYHGEQRRHGATERRLAATKGVVTKMKNRAKAGICPCCNRHFEALERHMATKHPDFAGEDA